MSVIAAAVFLLSQAGGSIHELQLDMTKTQVTDVVGELGPPDPEWIGKEEVHKVAGGQIFFCNGKLHTVMIDMTPSVQSFTRLVDAETQARGAPTYTFQHKAWGAVEAEWRMAPYKYLRIVMLQYRSDSALVVQKVLSTLGPCNAPPR